MCEARLAVQSNGENAAGYRNVHLSFLEFGRVFLIVCADDLLRRLLPGELVRVRVKSQTRYLFQFFLALQKLIARFEFQAALRFSLSRAQYSERVREASRKRRSSLVWYNARRRSGAIVFWRKKQGSLSSRSSVQNDWVARLPQHRHDFYQSLVREWEDAYAILSVVLDEAFTHRSRGELVKAREAAQIAAAVVNRLGEPLLAAYRTLEMRGRRLAAIPAVSPLDPEFFRGEAAQQNATWNQLLHRILFGSRSRYLHKLRALEMTVCAVVEHFQETAEDLADGVQVHPQESWSALDTLHYDLNTCLRESIVMLKSFLRVLPDAGVEGLRDELNASVSAVRSRIRPKLAGLTRVSS